MYIRKQYAQRCHSLYSQASEQNSNIINRQLIIDSASNVTVLSGNNLQCVKYRTHQCIYKEDDLHCSDFYS